MSSPDAATDAELGRTIGQLSGVLSDLIAAGRCDAVCEADIQSLVTAAIRLYVARREAGAEFLPFNEQDVTGTEVLISAAAMLEAARLEVFELTMWRGFGTV